MENVLKAKIVGDITDYKAKMAQVEAVTEKSTKEIIQLQTELRRLKKEYQTGSIDLDTYSKRVAKINNDLNAHTRAITQARGSFKAISGDIGAANGVALEFNRIIQDAPYGIIGVANNLQQVGSNFGQLATQAGGAGKALSLSLRALVSGINPYLIAFNALTVVLTLYSQGVIGAEKDTKALKEQLDEFKESLDSVSQATLNAYNSSQKELETLKALKGVIESEAYSRVQRNNAVSELQKMYPNVFGNMEKEKILAGGLAKSYEALTKTIIARANAEAQISKIVELAEEERLILEKTADQRARIADFEAKALNAQVQGQIELQTINENQARFLKNDIVPETNRLAEIEKERGRLTRAVQENLAEANAILDDSGIKSKKLNDSLESVDDNIAKIELSTKTANEAMAKLEGLAAELAKSMGLIGGDVKNIDLGISFDPNTLDSLTEEQKKVIEQLQDFRTRAINLNQEVGNLIQKGLTDMISQTFFAFGEAIGNGENAIGAAGKALLGSFAAFLGQFGKLLIQYGIAGQSYAVITKALLSPLTAGPASIAAIAAGAALIAISGAISGALRQSGSASIGGGSISPDRYSNIPGREFGGPVVAGRPYIVGERRAELFIPQTNGIILPSLGIGTASSPLNGFSNTKEMMIRVEVEGVLENEQIRLANKRGEHRIKRT